MDKSREELEEEYTEAIAKLEQCQHRGQRYENRIRYYIQSERAFFLLMEKLFSLPEVAALVSQAADQQKGG